MSDAWETQRAELRLALKTAGLKQSEVAELLGTTQKHISCVLNGKTAGTLDLWMRLAGLLGMTWSLTPLPSGDPLAEWVREELHISMQPWQVARLRERLADAP